MQNCVLSIVVTGIITSNTLFIMARAVDNSNYKFAIKLASALFLDIIVCHYVCTQSKYSYYIVFEVELLEFKLHLYC